MRDRIDVERAAQAVQQERQRNRRGCLSVLVLGAVAALMVYTFAFVLNPWRRGSDGLFYLAGGRWQEIKDLPGSPQDVQVSPGGTVWVQISFRRGLARWDGTRWQHYRGEDFGTEANSLRGGFALVGEQVWGVTEDAVVHFDGQVWRAYPEALSSDTAEAITASESEVWVLDRKGNLSHLDGERWTISHLRDALPDVDWGRKYSFLDLALARTPDGTLWLDAGGLWRFDGAAWQEVHTGEGRLSKPQIVGVTGDRLWVWSDHYLSWVTSALDWGCYSTDDLGLAADARVYQVIAQDDRLWIASSEGVLISDGTTWERLPLPAGRDYVSHVALAPDGTVWVIGGESGNLLQMAFFLLSVLVIGIGGIVLALVTLNQFLKGLAQRQREITRRVAPDQAEPEQPPPSLWEAPSWRQIALLPLQLIVLLAILIPLILALDRARARVWPDAPEWLLGLLVLILVTLIVSVGRRFIAALRASHDEGLSLRQSIRQGAEKLIELVVIFIFLDVVLEELPDLLPLTGAHFIFFLLATVALVLLVLLAVFLLPSFWVQGALRRADYAGALRRVHFLRRLSSRSAMFLYLHGTVHLFAGEYQEAEARLREALEREQKSLAPTVGATLENLGCALAGQGRYEEAVKALEDAVEIAPDAAGPYVALAGVYLRQGVQAERALELLAQAQENKGSSLLKSRADRYRWAEIWADRAWALTLQGRHIEAAEALEQAFKKRDRKFKPGLADLHCRMGKVMRLRGDKAAAIEHWQQAQQIDPQGEAGQWAARLLQELT